MNGKSRIDQRKSGGDGDYEVDMLLRAAEDEVLLNVSVNSHMARGVSQSSYIDPDLDRRFQALKSSPSKATQPTKPQQPPPPRTTEDADDDDLLARFAALKSSLPSSTCSFSSPKKSNFGDEQSDWRTIPSDEDDVQKVIQWAIDAARLDPSPPTDDDDNNADSSDGDGEGDDFYDSDDCIDDHQKKGKTKKGQERK